MSTEEPENPAASDPGTQSDPHVMIVGPDGTPVTSANSEHSEEDDAATDLASLVEEPAKVMRIGRMVQTLLEEVKAAPVDEAGRTRLAGVLHTSIVELKQGLAPELDAELDRLIAPFDSQTPSESELRIAQATLVGWLEGLFHGIQTAIYAQQMAARAQLQQMRALPPGMVPGMGEQQGQAQEHGSEQNSGGMYL